MWIRGSTPFRMTCFPQCYKCNKDVCNYNQHATFQKILCEIKTHAWACALLREINNNSVINGVYLHAFIALFPCVIISCMVITHSYEKTTCTPKCDIILQLQPIFSLHSTYYFDFLNKREKKFKPILTEIKL